jgi:hypothetical protein
MKSPRSVSIRSVSTVYIGTFCDGLAFFRKKCNGCVDELDFTRSIVSEQWHEGGSFKD